MSLNLNLLKRHYLIFPTTTHLPYHLNDSKATEIPKSLVVFSKASANGP